jgi:fatty acid desaturase
MITTTVLVDRPDRSLLPPLAELGIDLAPPTRTRQVWVIGRPFGFVALYAVLAAHGWWIPALAAAVFTFIAASVAFHDLVHGALGTSKRVTRAALTVTAALVLENGPALRRTHLQHHYATRDESDPEGYIESMSWPRLLREAPRYRWHLWAWAWRHYPHDRRAIARAALLVAVFVAAAIAIPSPELRVFVLVMQGGGLMFPILTAKGPQNGFGLTDPARTIVRGRVTPRLMMGLWFHLEHHLYPEVPVYRLAALAKALDPWLRQQGAQLIRMW